jgi:hypothetical protein
MWYTVDLPLHRGDHGDGARFGSDFDGAGWAGFVATLA